MIHICRIWNQYRWRGGGGKGRGKQKHRWRLTSKDEWLWWRVHQFCICTDHVSCQGGISVQQATTGTKCRTTKGNVRRECMYSDCNSYSTVRIFLDSHHVCAALLTMTQTKVSLQFQSLKCKGYETNSPPNSLASSSLSSLASAIITDFA